MKTLAFQIISHPHIWYNLTNSINLADLIKYNQNIVDRVNMINIAKIIIDISIIKIFNLVTKNANITKISQK